MDYRNMILNRINNNLKPVPYKGVSYDFKHNIFKVMYDGAYFGSYHNPAEAGWSWDFINLILCKHKDEFNFKEFFEINEYGKKLNDFDLVFKTIDLIQMMINHIKKGKLKYSLKQVKEKYDSLSNIDINDNYLPDFLKIKSKIYW